MKIILFNEDSIQGMSELPENSIDLVVTSPPYFVGKEYEVGVTFDNFTKLIDGMFGGCSRIVKPGGYVVINFGDINNNNRIFQSDVPSTYPASHFYWEISKKYEVLCLQSIRIWRKIFARMTNVGCVQHHPRNVFDYEYIWTWRKRDGIGDESRFVSTKKRRQMAVRGVVGEKDKLFNDDWEQWNSKANTHTSAFPVELPLWAISLYSFEGDIVLDPFMGSGTTGVAAKKLKRNFVGYEINESYFNDAKKHIDETNEDSSVTLKDFIDI